MRNVCSRTTVAAVFVLSSSMAVAQTRALPAPIFTTSAPQSKSIIVENEYRYVVMDYVPPVEVTIVSKDNASYSSPESSAIASISAMATLDFAWFRNTWDAPSNSMMDARDRELKRDSSFWINAWKRGFEGRTFRLTSRIDTGEYVIIVYRAVRPIQRDAATDKDIEQVTVLKRDGDKWLATQDLSQDPVLQYRTTPAARPKRVVR